MFLSFSEQGTLFLQIICWKSCGFIYSSILLSAHLDFSSFLCSEDLLDSFFYTYNKFSFIHQMFFLCLSCLTFKKIVCLILMFIAKHDGKLLEN